MIDWEELKEFFGPVQVTTITCDTTVTLMVAPAGKRLRVFKIIVDSPTEPPLFTFEAL